MTTKKLQLIFILLGLNLVSPVYAIQFKQIGTGFFYSCGINLFGKVLCWGENSDGQFGHRDFDSISSPIPIHSTLLNQEEFTQISTGTSHICVLSSLGRVYCWGGNMFGQLGRGTIQLSGIPQKIQIENTTLFSEISSGGFHTCGISQDRQIYCWGRNSQGQLGINSYLDSPLPQKVQTREDLRFKNMSAGYHHTCGITYSGKIYCWGANTEGQLGNGTRQDSIIPLPIKAPKDLSFTQVSAGSFHTCAISQLGKAYCWGENTRNQLGINIPYYVKIPTPVSTSNDISFTQISSGYSHTCGISSSFQIFCWGENSLGQLGIGDQNSWSSAVLPMIPAGLQFTQVSANTHHTCALSLEGEAYCWGGNHYGQLGTGNHLSQLIPTQVANENTNNVLSSSSDIIFKIKNASPRSDFSQSELREFIDLYLTRVTTNTWPNSFQNNLKTISISEAPSPLNEGKEEGEWIYKIIDLNFAQKIGLQINTWYRLDEIQASQKEAVLNAVYSQPINCPVDVAPGNLLNPEFDSNPIPKQQIDEIEKLLQNIQEEIIQLPQPNPEHLINATYIDHRVGVHANPYDKETFLKILLAMKTKDRTSFVKEMAHLATCFPIHHSSAQREFLNVFTRLYVTGEFASLGIKQTYYHFLLRCGQIYND